MSIRPFVRAAGVLSTVTALALAPGVAAAQSADSWQFGAALYGYFPTVSGKTIFPSTAGGSHVSVDADTILDSLEFAFMGSFEARKGQWGVLADVLYMDLGNSKSGTRDFSIGQRGLPADVAANVDYNLKGLIWTLAGTYRAISRPEYTLDFLAGARSIGLDQTVDWNLTGQLGSVALPDRAGHSEISDTNWDAIVGVKGRAAFGDRKQWFVPYYLDIGAGESSFTWQAMTGLGYSFGWGDILAAWRYLDYDMKSGDPVESMSFNGPALAVILRW